MAVRIVTDSSSGLPAEITEELGITVVDLHLVASENQVSTAGLSALELTAAYARQLERGGDAGVVALHLSKELSSTWSAAHTAAAVFDGAVDVVDTQSVGMCVGAAAMAAARLAQGGASLRECADMARDTLRRSETWLYLHRMEEMRRSGRITTATAVVSAALATKPIMQLRGGHVELALKTRTQSKAFARLVAVISDRSAGEPAFVAIQHHQALEAAHSLQSQLTAALPKGSSFMIMDMDQALSVHCGVGALGISVVFSSYSDTAATDLSTTS
ncbi:DegV family protein [Corynebacterium diphtheriae]|uniref:DegV family protein n=1 Tax=Corynebacterium diphtheriae TaxID=1717 RepID=UPI000B4A6F96|nr:DegV family protein [Corynebacterium diphtheriae]OWN40646.1 fatty acid-binding protein DegV [Corynebacterium belfantii]OWM47182.1 fatty acid-binding protein DegV [Corynebacterium diphtheriae]OWN04046.1 fatty acid-binding protein DegV [Corynebacterium diphtheriae bv. mitis]OWN27350.1 fatty acid-binding protein DegV [Corynebacterium diphtheriae bv. mitis]OWO29139.1 fatty acid-binding protein DegV [Corynebacterium diphtheriae bv. mitis]